MMSPRTCLPLLCLLLLIGGTVGRKFTEKEKKTMRDGIEAGQRISKALNTATFNTAMDETKKWIPTYSSGMSSALDFFKCTEDLILEEVIKGFKQVNARLDVIITQLGEIKKLIQWGDMQVKFQDIEYKIRLMDQNLQIALSSPDRSAGVARFIRVYNAEYSNAGFALYDAIAKNDQVFSRNLLSAASKFSDQHRKKVQQFSRGLTGLVLKAAAIEIAYDKLTKINVGQKAIWDGRVKECADAMKKMDKHLEATAWKGQANVDAQKIGYEHKDEKDHEKFSTNLYDFLIEKYYWRHWIVVAYDGIKGTNAHSHQMSSTSFVSFRKYNRNFIVSSADPNDKQWDARRAKSYIKSYRCRALPHLCHRGMANWMIKLSPKYGQAKIVVQRKTRIAIKCRGDHYAWGWGNLNRISPGWYGQYQMVYFG